MTSTITDPHTTYYEHSDLADGALDALGTPMTADDEARLSELLAESCRQLALLAPTVHGEGHVQTAADRDTAQVTALLADLATARATGQARTVGLISAIEEPLGELLDAMATPGSTTAGLVWVHAYERLVQVLADADFDTDVAAAVVDAHIDRDRRRRS